MSIQTRDNQGTSAVNAAIHSPVSGELVERSFRDSARNLCGKFIVIDGPDGAGKTTQLKMLTEGLRELGLTVTSARDPGGTLIGEGIRELLLHLPEGPSRPAPYCELLLFMASRAQLVSEVISPSMSRGEVVFCDRFVWSTLAYQAANGSDIEDIMAIARGAIGTHWPDLTVLLDVPVEVGMTRVLESRGMRADAIEQRSLDYRKRVRDLYLSMPGRFNTPMVVIDAGRGINEVHALIKAALVSAEFV